MKKGLLLIIGSVLHLGVYAQFSEVSAEVGIDHTFEDNTQISSGAAIFDMNNDSLLDLYLTGGLLGDKLYMNNGSGFSRATSYLEPEDFDFYQHYSTGVASGDVNNDGFDDLLVCGWRDYPSLLYMNKGNGKFDIIPPAESGITSTSWATGAGFGDINEDGYLDLFIHNYIDTGRSATDPEDSLVVFQHIGYRNDLYLNQGDGSFAEASEAYGITRRSNSLASTFTDYDQDGDVDLYVVNDFGEDTEPNELYANAYPALFFNDVSSPAGADIGLFGMGVAIGDYDGDLDLDYYITNLGRNVLLRNSGDGTFEDVTHEAGVGDSAVLDGRAVGWGTGFFDYDNDGDLDLYIANGRVAAAYQIYNPDSNANALYRNNGDGTFTDVRDQMSFNDPSIFRGAAFGDLNQDGLLDIVCIPSNKPFVNPLPGLREEAAIYHNITTNSNNWIQFKLVGDTSNASGYGAQLFLYDESGRVQLRESDGGSSHGSSNTPYIHFGLGTASAVDSVVIVWPRGLVQTVRQPPINQLIVIGEGDDLTVPLSAYEKFTQHINIYPNPTTDQLIVDAGTASGLRYSISKMDGRTITSGWLNKGLTNIPTGKLPVGPYLFSYYFNGKLIKGRVFMKQ